MKKRILTAVLAAVLVTGTCAATVSAKEEKTYTIGICQLVQHDALDAATKGFEDAITEKMGDSVKFDEQNAQGDSNTCSTIINSFVSEGADLILANATASLQAAAAGTSDIPILGTAVTEYGVALGIDDFDGTVGGNISGTSDLAPLDEQADMLHELFPDAKNVGLLYCSAEPNSQYQVDTVKDALEKLGYTCEDYAFSDSNDLSSVVTTAANDSDVIYAPTDNTVASNTEIINNICLPAKVPVIAGEEGICQACVLQHFPSATMILDTKPAKWQSASFRMVKISPKCRLNMHQNSQKNTTKTSVTSLVLKFRMDMKQSKQIKQLNNR